MSPSRFAIGLLGWLLIQTVISHATLAQQDRLPLRLLILRPDKAPGAPAKSNGVDDAAIPALSNPTARAITNAFIGHPIDDALLGEIQDRIRGYYTDIGRPFIEIAIPAQDVSAGTLRIDVIETKLGQIKVEGNHWFDDQQYISAIRTRSGNPIDTKRLAADTDWLNRDPHRQATIALGPASQPSTYDLTVRAKDRLPLDITLAVDNTGTSDTGLYRVGIGLDWTNAFWRGDGLSYGFLTSPDQFRLLEHVLTYRTYLPWRDSITISGITADTRGQEVASSNGMSVNGHSSIVSFRYTATLPGTPEFLHQIDLGYDFKSTDSNILTGGSAVFPSTSELNQFVVAYGFRNSDTYGLTGVTMTLVGSPGHLTPRNTQAALATQQVGATPSYLYGRVSIDRLTTLPFDNVYSAKLTAQYSSDNLFPSEQLVFGGIQSVRGFMELNATRDTGILMQNEFRTAPLKLLWRNSSSDAETMTPFVFLDLGAGRNHLDLPGIRRSWLKMVSTGPGFTWTVVPNAILRMSWGIPLIRNGHTGPLLGPQFGMQVTF